MGCPYSLFSGYPQLSPISPRTGLHPKVMARKKRSLLPQVTTVDIELTPEKVRRTATGWAWKCVYCGQFASSETLAGKYVCRSHGGVTSQQRSPEVRDAARQSGKRIPQPPGRPLKTGLYSRRPKLRVDELVEDYQERKMNADNTDEDMLYLRAYLAEMIEGRPALNTLEQPLRALTQHLESRSALSSIPRADDEVVLSEHELGALVRETRELLKMVTSYTEKLERRHERLIKLSKVRAETRLKNSAAQQVEVFSILVRRLQVILEEHLSPAELAALQQRFAKELSELPVDAVEGRANIQS